MSIPATNRLLLAQRGKGQRGGSRLFMAKRRIHSAGWGESRQDRNS